MNMSQYGIMEINYRRVLGGFVLGFAMLPNLVTAETMTAQPQFVEQPGQQLIPAWVEPPSGPYQFVPPQPAELMPQPIQPDAGQATMPPERSAGYPEYQGGWYPPVGQMPLPAPDRGYAYEYHYQYQPPGTGAYGYNRTMPPPAGAYGYGAYPRNNYPAGMRPNYYPYGPAEQGPMQPYYR